MNVPPSNQQHLLKAPGAALWLYSCLLVYALPTGGVITNLAGLSDLSFLSRGTLRLAIRDLVRWGYVYVQSLGEYQRYEIARWGDREISRESLEKAKTAFRAGKLDSLNEFYRVGTPYRIATRTLKALLSQIISQVASRKDKEDEEARAKPIEVTPRRLKLAFRRASSGPNELAA